MSQSRLKKKATEVSKQGNTENGVTQNSRSVVNISIAQLFKNINPIDEQFTKYIPKNFFDDGAKIQSRDEEIRDAAIKHFGVTYSWNETGYITTDGKRLDFSGKNNGAPGGYRAVDHRDIWDSYPEDLQDEYSGYSVALTDIKDKRGNDVIVAVHINRRHNRNVIQKIASLYSKSDSYGNNRINQYVMNQIDSGNLIDVSNKKAPNWFTSRGLQLPKLVQTIIDANTIIADSSENINTPGEKRMNQSRGDLFDDDDLFTEDTTVENIFARHYITHAAEIGEVL